MMRELADNILDIAQNSIAAGASLVEIDISVSRAQDTVSLAFIDDGCGMSEDMVRAVCDPFTTTRKTRKVGLGLPLLKMTAQATGGEMSIASKPGEGTTVRVTFGLSHIDRPPMGDVPGAFFRMMCENEAFDVESRPNKWGGGYCTEFPKFRQPFILANFNGTSGDVDVVTHEAGHALNAYLIADNRFALELGCGGMETAETHSMSMEFFAWPYLDAFFPKAGDAERYRFQHALDALSFLPYGTMVDEFQHRVYAEPGLTPAERNAVWLELEAKYRPYIDQSGIPYLERGTRWQYQMHIYETPFYYIDYCLAQTAAFQFLLASQDDYDDAFARYLHLSQQGGEKLWTDLLAEAGFRSPFEPGALAQLAARVEPLIRKHTV